MMSHEPSGVADASPHLVACPRPVPICLVPADLLDCIGNTPIVHMKQASEETGCTILAKAEYLNPGGSIKDRIAKSIIEQAESRGSLKPGSTIPEVTSGNTGVAIGIVIRNSVRREISCGSSVDDRQRYH